MQARRREVEVDLGPLAGADLEVDLPLGAGRDFRLQRVDTGRGPHVDGKVPVPVRVISTRHLGLLGVQQDSAYVAVAVRT